MSFPTLPMDYRWCGRALVLAGERGEGVPTLETVAVGVNPELFTEFLEQHAKLIRTGMDEILHANMWMAARIKELEAINPQHKD